jgi:hypothetical protein
MHGYICGAPYSVPIEVVQSESQRWVLGRGDQPALFNAWKQNAGQIVKLEERKTLLKLGAWSERKQSSQ